MSIPVFLSYPKPYNEAQVNFIGEVEKHLRDNNFSPRTLGVTDYDMSAPLIKIREMMYECDGLLSIAFRRAHIKAGIGKPSTQNEYIISDQWLTSPYCHIEPSMAFQLNLPTLIFREKGVIDDGILEKGVAGTYLPEFDLTSTDSNYLESEEWCQLIIKWKSLVVKNNYFKDFKSENIVQRLLGYFSFENKPMSSKRLYQAFEDSNNNYDDFMRLINVDEHFEKVYRIYDHSLHSDYITIYRKYFQNEP